MRFWRIYLGLVCGAFLLPAIALILFLAGVQAAFLPLLGVAAVCAVLVVLIFLAGALAMILGLFRKGPPRPGWGYGWRRWHH
jgi:hypothetical protein